MKYLASLLLLVASIGLGSCTHKPFHYKVTGDYLIAGWAGGFTVVGAHSNFYLISGGALREDTNVSNNLPPDDINGFNFNILLPASKYATVANIPSSIPSELLSRNNEHIGGIFPDLGYRDVRTSVNGTSYRWYFEGDQSSSSIAVQQFVSSLDTLSK